MKTSRGWNSDSQLRKKNEDAGPEISGGSNKRAELTRSLAASLGTIQISRNLNIFKTGSGGGGSGSGVSSGSGGYAMPEKERSKVMQTIEGKLMVAIKVFEQLCIVAI